MPDGDTGSNLSSTLGSVLQGAFSRRSRHLGEMLVGIGNSASDGARGNSEIQAMVAAGVVQALRAYDAGLPERIGQIGMDPRYRG